MNHHKPTIKYELRVNGFFYEELTDLESAERKYLEVKDTVEGEVTILEVVESTLLSSHTDRVVPFSTKYLLQSLRFTLEGWDATDCEMVFDVEPDRAEDLLNIRDFIQENYDEHK